MIVSVPDALLGPARCTACGAEIVWALSPAGHLVAVDLSPAHRDRPGPVELFAEYFPGGDPVDGVQRVRMRPLERATTSPSWTLHWGAPRPCRSVG